MTQQSHETPADERLVWPDSIPFVLMHLAPFAVFWTGFTTFDVLLCIGLHGMRMFFITAGYHRYFGHRAFKTGRVMQFVLAFGGGTAAQKGALWWAGHHRHHHKHSDHAQDVHSPSHGFWWSHILWITCRKWEKTEWELIQDFAKYPELRLLDRHHWIPPTVLGVLCYLAGGWSALVVGFFLSTVLSYHSTFCINSLTHMFGQRRYATRDRSRNSLVMALITFGEGWHNNHHHYPASARMGFFWWEVDLSFYLLKALAALGLVWDLKPVPQRALLAKRVKDGHIDVGMLPAAGG